MEQDFLQFLMNTEMPAIRRAHDIELPQTQLDPVPIRDQRPVAPSQRLRGVDPQKSHSIYSAMGQAARSAGVDPKLATALAVTEGEDQYGGNYSTAGLPPEAQQLAIAEQALRHLRERASAVGGPLERQLQAYNGMGKLAPGHYGQNRVIDAGKELPYGKRIMEVLQGVVNKSPELLNTIMQRRPTAVSPMAGFDHLFADEIIKDMNIRKKKPNLLK